jgi:SAM-dependent methyltransferase
MRQGTDMAAGASPDFAGKTCSAPPARSARMATIALASIPADRPVRVLDLGCGTGSLVFLLAAARPLATIVGLDISAANIRAAEAARRLSNAASRISFEQADYRAYRAEPFDAVVSDGVLHLIPGDTRALFEKIAGDLRPGAVFVCAMPYDCLYNRTFAIVRRGLRLVRSRAVDALILFAARTLHGREMDLPALRERIDYMYLPPTRMLDRATRDRVAPSAGLRAISQHAMPSTSPSQLRHNVTIFERIYADA